MNSKQRVQAICNLQPVDKIPVMHNGVSAEVASRILGRPAYVGGGSQQWRHSKALWEGEEAEKAFAERSLDDAIDIGIALGHDMLRVNYWRMYMKPTEKIDEFTYRFGEQIRRYIPETELFEPINQIQAEVDDPIEAAIRACENAERQADMPVNKNSQQFENYRKAKALVHDEYAIRAEGGGLGFMITQMWLEVVAMAPEVAGRFLKAQADAGIKQIKAMAEEGHTLLMGGGDLAGPDGPIYSPKFFQKYVMPQAARLAQAARENDVILCYASDGNLWPVADMLFGEAGVQGYLEIEGDAGMDYEKLRARYPKLVMMGNLSSGLVHLGTPEQIRQCVKQRCKQAKDCRGILLGTSNMLMVGTPDDNLKALRDALEEFR